MPNPIESEIKNRISAFVAELDQLVRRSTLEALQGILANGAAPVRRGPGRPAGSGRGPARPAGRRGRAPADLGAANDAILNHVRANDGQGIGAISQATGVDLKTAKKAAIQLLASGALKKSGVRRGTVYHVGSGKPARAKAGKRGKKAKKKSPSKARRKPAAVLKPVRRARPTLVKSQRPTTTDVPAALALAE